MFRDDLHMTLNKRVSKYYTWTDSQWSSFMVAIMQNLEPRLYIQNENIFHDMEEVEEIIYV